MAAAIFYIGFILGAYPAVLLAQRYPIERVASSIIVVWGLTLILTPVCTDFRGLYAQRFFLGFTEAGISPMFMMIVVRVYIPTRSRIVILTMSREAGTQRVSSL